MARVPGQRPLSGRRATLNVASACASLALVWLCLLIAASATFFAPGAHAAPAVSPTPTDTPVPPTATPVPPPTLALVSPSSGQGPVGARMTLSGAYWITSSVSIGVALDTTSCGAPASWEQTMGFVTPKVAGALDYSFTWPAALPPTGTPYAICAFATGLAPAAVSYQVRAALPPTLSLSDAVAAPGQSVTVAGAHFIGASSVNLSLLDPAGVKRTLGKQTPAADGSFSFIYTPNPPDLGLVTLTATSPAEGGALPALEASVTVNVQSALTPTVAPHPTVTPLPAPTSTPVAVVAPPRLSLDLYAGMVVALTLALLALAGSAFVVVFRLRAERRREEELARRARTRRLPVAAGRIGDLDSDTDPSMLVTGGHGATRRFSSVDGGDDEDAGYDDTGWDEDEGPGPDWQPRPMTGSGPIFGAASYPRAADTSDDEPTDASVSNPRAVASDQAPPAGNDMDAGATVAAGPPPEDDAPAEGE